MAAAFRLLSVSLSDRRRSRGHTLCDYSFQDRRLMAHHELVQLERAVAAADLEVHEGLVAAKTRDAAQ